jgi:DNA-binding transcriptional regulator YdaS (Cro superfamily)
VRAAGAVNGQACLARLLQVAPATVNQWARGHRPVPVERCAAIERATSGVVRRWDLRPDDWHLIWPELVGTEGAPAVADVQEVADAA